MRANSRSLYFLCVLFVMLLFFSIHIILNNKETTNNFEYIKEGYVKLNENITFPLDIHNDIKPMDYIDDIVNETGSKYDSILSITFDIDEVGMQRGDISFKYKDIITSRSFTYSVIDSDVPVLYLDKPIVIKQGSTLNLDEFVSVKDNSLKEDEKIVPQVLGGFDTSRVGIFNVVIEAIDESGNQASFATTITVTNAQGSLGVTSQESRPVETTPQPVKPPVENPPVEKPPVVKPPVVENPGDEIGEGDSESNGNLQEEPQEGDSDE